MTKDQIEYMTRRFLNWKLPENWKPDGGISFEPYGNKGTPHQYKREAVGTNLLGYEDAEEMIRYMIDGMPGPSDPAQEPEAVCVGIDRGGEDATALSLRRGTDLFVFTGERAEIIISAIEQASRPVSPDREAVARIVFFASEDGLEYNTPQNDALWNAWKDKSETAECWKAADAILALIEGRT